MKTRNIEPHNMCQDWIKCVPFYTESEMELCNFEIVYPIFTSAEKNSGIYPYIFAV